jgi:hypothetical protein
MSPAGAKNVHDFLRPKEYQGVYTLDVITQKGNTKAAYEGILVIGQQPATIIEETINRENGDIIIIPPDEPPPTPPITPPVDEPPVDDGDGGDGGGEVDIPSLFN